MKKNKIIVFGGGLSGLTASLLLLKKGHDVTIIDKNHYLGGYCTTYIKNDAYIDTCIHYIVGCKKSKLSSLYSTLGFFENNNIIKFPYFYKFNYFNQSIEISRDFNKFKENLLSIAEKEDINQLKSFFRDIKSFFNFPIKTPAAKERMNAIDYAGLVIKNFRGLKSYLKFKKISINQYASAFKTPIINEFIRSMMPNNVSIAPFLGLLASYFKGNADTVDSLSKDVVENIKRKIIKSGGQIILNEEIKKLNIEGNKLISISSNKNEYKADYYISGIPLTYLYSNLLKKEYHDKEIDKTLFNYIDNPPISAFLAYYKIKPNCNTQLSDYFIKFVPNGFKCLSSTNRSIGFKYYPHILNKDGSHTLVCIIDQNYDDYILWKKMNEAEYNNTKKNIAKQIEKELYLLYPELTNKVELVETLTPLSLYKSTYNFGGSYMANLMSETSNRSMYKYSSNKIKNLIFSSMWMTNLGGIPSALTSGECAYKETLIRIKKGA